MMIEKYTTSDGWPGVGWRQEVPTGDSWYSWARRAQIGVGSILGFAMFLWVFRSDVTFGWSVFWGGVVAFAIIAPEAFNRIGTSLAGQSGSGGGKSEWERGLVSSWKARPVFRSEVIRAELSYDKVKGFTFCLAKGSAVDCFPLAAFDRFELGTAQDWFGDVAERELTQLEHRAASLVIVAAVQGRGVVRIAESGRDKAGMSELLLVLSEAFIDGRKALLGRVA